MPRKKGKGRAVKRARQKFGAHYENEDVKLAPHSMIIHRGDVSKDIRVLINDFRKVMEPFTASELKTTRKNSLKDFISIAGPLHVTHLIMFSQTELEDHLKIVRLPRGPTIHFNVLEYSLRNDVLSVLKRKQTHQKQFLHQPLLILNGFNLKQTEGTDKNDFHLKLLTTTLQNMFPSINVTNVKLNDIRRCVLFNYNKTDGTIDFRQYNIKLKPVGLSKPVKKLAQEKIPDLSKYQDISEFIENGGNLSESEAEFDGPENQVEINQENLKNKLKSLSSSTSAIRLSEIGPRLKIKLIKIEEGVCEGPILFHDLIKGTEKEIETIRENLKLNKKLEKSKNDTVKEKKKNSRDKKSKKEKDEADQDNDGDDDLKEEDLNQDIEYYKQELGEEPDADFIKKFKRGPKRKQKDLKVNFKHYLNDEEKNPDKSDRDSDFESKPNKIAKFDSFSQAKSKPKFLRLSNKKKQIFSNKKQS